MGDILSFPILPKKERNPVKTIKPLVNLPKGTPQHKGKVPKLDMDQLSLMLGKHTKENGDQFNSSSMRDVLSLQNIDNLQHNSKM